MLANRVADIHTTAQLPPRLAFVLLDSAAAAAAAAAVASEGRIASCCVVEAKAAPVRGRQQQGGVSREEACGLQ